MGTIIGRDAELQLLEAYASSGKAEFVALYGRRRVGKTFLVREHFKNRFAFEMTGTRSRHLPHSHHYIRLKKECLVGRGVG